MILIGLRCKTYIDLMGAGEGTWALLDKIGDVGLSMTVNEVEIKERAEEETGVVLAHRVREATIQITRRPGDTLYDGLKAAFLAKTFVGVAFMDKAIATVGAKGYQADMYITAWNENQAVENAVVDITLKRAADSDTPPADVTISGGGG